ncbi:MAG: electron transport complex subunit RsxC [Elusimicrobiota bacterium]
MPAGIKIKSYKSASRYDKIEQLPFPQEAVVYTLQHIGAPAKPVVKKGDEVKRGQLIAEGQGRCSSDFHAPVGGKVTAVSLQNRPDGKVSEAITIKKEGDQAPLLMEPLGEITSETVRERVRMAGIVGMGGAGFPAYIKLNPPKKIETVLLNGCECEPYLTADERMMIEDGEKIVAGFVLVRDTVGAAKGLIGIEKDKKEAISNMSRIAAYTKGIEVVELQKVYPQGCEKMLITAVTGKEVPLGGLPHDIGISVHNVGTCLAVHEAVCEGKPLIERVITVCGPEMIKSVNVRTAIGTRISEILGYYQVEKRETYNILMGGPMMGFSIDSAELPVLKTTSGILLKSPEKHNEYPCMVCGKCVDVCPVQQIPQRLNRFYDGKDYDRMKEEGLLNCMECGCCSYICPSGIPLTYKFKTAKTLL